LGNKLQVGHELIRPNQVVNPIKELWRRGREWDGDEVKFVPIVHGCEHLEHGGYSWTWTY